MNEELSVEEVKNRKLVGAIRSLFEKEIVNIEVKNPKPLFNSQEKKSNKNDQNKENNADSGRSSEVIHANEKSNADVRNQIIQMHEKVSKIENEIVQKNKEATRKNDETHELMTSVEKVLSQTIQKLNALHLDNKMITQTLFDQSKKKSLRSLQNTQSENNNVEEAVDDNYVRDALKKIQEIKADVEKLQERARSFSGTKDDLDYLDIGFKLLENIMKVDVIQAHGIEDIRMKKKEAIERADASKDILDSNLIPTK